MRRRRAERPKAAPGGVTPRRLLPLRLALAGLLAAASPVAAAQDAPAPAPAPVPASDEFEGPYQPTDDLERGLWPVSYTHLTLPTKRIV